MWGVLIFTEGAISVLTFHFNIREVLFLLTSLGAGGGSGSHASVLKLTGSVASPFKSSNKELTLECVK